LSHNPTKTLAPLTNCFSEDIALGGFPFSAPACFCLSFFSKKPKAYFEPPSPAFFFLIDPFAGAKAPPEKVSSLWRNPSTTQTLKSVHGNVTFPTVPFSLLLSSFLVFLLELLFQRSSLQRPVSMAYRRIFALILAARRQGCQSFSFFLWLFSLVALVF